MARIMVSQVRHEYDVVVEEFRGDLVAEVNNRYIDGWRTTGGVSMCYNGNAESMMWAQAIERVVLADPPNAED